MGYAIMSSTITGIAPFLRPFNKEYTTSYRYGVSNQKTPVRSSSPNDGSVLRPTVSQSYLMGTLPSRRASTRTIPGGVESNRGSATMSLTSEAGRVSPSSQAPIVLVADEHFRPADNYGRHEAEVWVGERSMSIGQEDKTSGPGDGLIVNKKTEFKIEIDRASRVI